MNEQIDTTTLGNNNPRNRAEAVIAHGAMTNSKRPSCFVEGVYPTHCQRGDGAFLYSETGQKYLDFICGLGTNFLGYADPTVNGAVSAALAMGNCHSLPTLAEIGLAETIRSKLSYMEKMRFLKTGSEGCSAAIRIARAFTGRETVLSDGYHGWHDSFVSLTPPHRGVPEDINITPLNLYFDDWHEVAAVIIEPVNLEDSPDHIQCLNLIRKKCDENNVVLIFDETITALRFPKLTVAKTYDVIPDISIMGKALGNGFPMSVVGGKKEVMEADYFVSSTFAGELSGIAATQAVFDGLSKNYWNPEDNWHDARMFQDKMNEILVKIGVSLEGYGTRCSLRSIDPLNRALFMQETCMSGILFGPSVFWNRHHTTEMENLLGVCAAIVRMIQEGKCKLRGQLPFSPFSERVRNAES